MPHIQSLGCVRALEPSDLRFNEDVYNNVETLYSFILSILIDEDKRDKRGILKYTILFDNDSSKKKRESLAVKAKQPAI